MSDSLIVSSILMNDWTLGIETTVPNASIALACGGEIIETRSFHSERSQECDLFLPMDDLLKALPNGARLSSIAVSTGPGSYNGARVGIAVAQALAQIHDCPVAGLCTFESTDLVQKSPHAWAVGDARRGTFFILPLQNGRVISSPELLKQDDFLQRLENCEGPRATLESPERLPPGTEATQVRPSAELLLKSWHSLDDSQREKISAIPVEAFYLRPPHITKSTKKSPLDR